MTCLEAFMDTVLPAPSPTTLLSDKWVQRKAEEWGLAVPE